MTAAKSGAVEACVAGAAEAGAGRPAREEGSLGMGEVGEEAMA